MPPMLMAILFVTVLVVDAETAVETTIVPVASGAVTVWSLAVLGAATVTDPPPVDLRVTGIVHTPQITVQLQPLGMVTVTPELIVTGPKVPEFWLGGML